MSEKKKDYARIQAQKSRVFEGRRRPEMQVTVLHRPLLDYLNEGEIAQLLLGSKAGDNVRCQYCDHGWPYLQRMEGYL